FVFGLAAELGLRHFHGKHTHQAFAHVIAGGVDLGALGQFVVGNVLVDDARHGRTQTGQVGTAIALRNVVGEAEHRLGIAVVPLHGHVHADCGVTHRGGSGNREDVVVQNSLAAVDVLHKALHTTHKGEVFFLALPLVNQTNLHTIVQEGQFTQPLGQNVVMEIDVLEDFGIGQKMHRGASFTGFTDHGQRSHALAATDFHFVHLAATLD